MDKSRARKRKFDAISTNPAMLDLCETINEKPQNGDEEDEEPVPETLAKAKQEDKDDYQKEFKVLGHQDYEDAKPIK